MKRAVIANLFAVLFFFNAFESIATELGDLRSDEIGTKVGQPEVIWIDVRTPAEFASGHVPGAVNIEFQEIGDRISAITTDKDAVINLYCKSGRRSSVAKQVLANLGYKRSNNVGSYAAALAHLSHQSGQ